MSRNYWFNDFERNLPACFNLKDNDIFQSLLNSDNFSALISYKGLKTDIKETDNSYVLDVEIPGFNKEDIKLELNDGVLVLTAETNKEVENKEENYIRKERVSGKVSRSFTFEKDIDEDAVKAKYNNGVLTVEVPKAKKIESKKGIIID